MSETQQTARTSASAPSLSWQDLAERWKAACAIGRTAQSPAH
ncbi:hypothetical protein [Litorisediminicola beolgyonensis]|uniref:Uncharacterized protein n=1 Tax=Litorisediminicola beolgyonensis TaxID=1173614 RepID=A0ABW3ZFG1_9RHOB